MFENDNKTVLLTGGTGFIGHHLFQYIMKNTDWNVVILDRFSYAGSCDRPRVIADAEHYYNRFKVICHDFRSSFNEDIKVKLSQYKFDFILHLAASTHVDRSISNPLDFVFDNVVGTCNLLEWYRYNSVKSTFLYFSTDEVFGPQTGINQAKEWDNYNSNNPYAATKAGAEELCLAYANTYDLDIRITHTMNVFAEGQHIEKFIPLCVKRIISGEEIQIHANADCTVSSSRCYIHAKKVAEAVLFVLKHGKQREKYNIVGQREITNEFLVLEIANILNKTTNYKLVDFHSSRPGHDLRYALDGSKLKNMGFCYNKGNFEIDLIQTVKWYEKQWNISAK